MNVTLLVSIISLVISCASFAYVLYVWRKATRGDRALEAARHDREIPEHGTYANL